MPTYTTKCPEQKKTCQNVNYAGFHSLLVVGKVGNSQSKALLFYKFYHIFVAGTGVFVVPALLLQLAVW